MKTKDSNTKIPFASASSSTAGVRSSGADSAPRPPPFKKIRLAKSQSKFERYGDTIIDFLQYAKKVSDPRIHWYQRDAVLKTRGLLLEDSGRQLQEGIPSTEAIPKPVLIVAPTGAGKTGMIALLPYVLKSKKVLVLTPTKVITSQLGDAFGMTKGKKSFFEHTGIITDIVDDESEATELLEMPKMISSPTDVTHDREIVNNVVIVNAQKFGGNSAISLEYKKKEIERGAAVLGWDNDGVLSLLYKNQKIVGDVRKFFDLFDTLLVDEAHHFPAKTWLNIVNAFSRPVPGMEKKIVFLTATPYRIEKGKKVFILAKSKEEEEEAKKRIAFVITPQELEGAEIRRTQFIEKENKDNVAQDILEKLKEQQKKEPRFRPQALVIVRTKLEAKTLVTTLNQSQNDPKFAVAIVAEKQSDELTQAFTKGEYRVGVVCGLLKEGYDNPKITLCVILRNITSRILFAQFVGRCMRINRSVAGGRGGGKKGDESVGVILSYKNYKQKKLWEEREMLPGDNEDPIEYDDD